MSGIGAGERALRDLVTWIQHRASSALGVDERKRGATVLTMLQNNARRAPGYWIQVFLAMGIATLGLVLGSTAVVIGAMLVSPLMGPLLELGMGFAVGSSLLVLRAFFRVVLSVMFVVVGAALFTLALPFHEVTSEIAARAAPTALDLLVAIFCALTAAYTTVRPGADSTAAAAGTAIGIALVPPLCTIGFGLGTGSSNIAAGASLLFVANLSAILVFAVFSFLILGFNQVDAVAIEEEFLADDDTRGERLAAQAHRTLRQIFGSRYGLAMRVLIPGIFLAGVYFPLRHALDEVTWEVRTRDAIRRIVAAETPHAMQSSVLVEQHTVSLRLLWVGTSERAAALESVLVQQIAAAAGVVPSVSVVPVSDARALVAANAAGRRADDASLATPLSELSQRIDGALKTLWPSVAGSLAGWELAISAHTSRTVVVRHIGAPLGASGAALLADALSARLGATVRVRDAPIGAELIAARRGRESAWLDSTLTLLDAVASTDSGVVCVQAPKADRNASTLDRRMLQALQTSDGAKAGRMKLNASGSWTAQAVIGSCPVGRAGAP